CKDRARGGKISSRAYSRLRPFLGGANVSDPEDECSGECQMPQFLTRIAALEREREELWKMLASIVRTADYDLDAAEALLRRTEGT
ncbi:MAG: hypothetical protein WCB19_02255, partial [Thermoplasmata archaeon]